MLAEITHQGKVFKVDLSQPIDISMPLKADKNAASAWYVDPIKIEPVLNEQFTGSVKLGGAVNFNTIFFNPHGNGTHTECVGHISEEFNSINQNLKQFFFLAELITVQPEATENGDLILTKSRIEEKLGSTKTEAIVIRTLPNDETKLHRNYSNTNPPYLTTDAVQYLINQGVEHILIDLPSVDREEDNGILAAHHLFWNYPEKPNLKRTITEFIYVNNSIKDGSYLLNLQIAPFENDATPSKPILYALI